MSTSSSLAIPKHQGENDADSFNVYLPTEIWYRILLFSKDPKTLSHLNRRLHELCQTPISRANWLSHQYKRDALLGALWHWRPSLLWRQWVSDVSLDTKLKVVIKTRILEWHRKCIRLYKKNWFDVEDDEKCKVCHGYSLVDPKEIDIDWIKYSHHDIPPEMLKELKDQIENGLKMKNCTREDFQITLFKLLIERGARYKKYLPLLCRFAATSGHIRLLHYLLTLETDLEFKEIVLTEKAQKILWILLGFSMAKGQLNLVHYCIATGCLVNVTDHTWEYLFRQYCENYSLKIAYLFFEFNSKTRFPHTLNSMRYASAIYASLKGKRIQLEKASLRILKTLPDAALGENDLFLVLIAIDGNRVDVIRYLRSKNLQFNLFDGLPLYQSVIFGKVQVVKVLLYECRVPTNIFTFGRVTMIFIIILDHAILLIALVFSILSFINEMVCIGQGLSNPRITMFDIAPGDEWCLPHPLYGTTSEKFGSIPILLFFSLLYFAFYRMVGLFPLLYSLFLILNEQRRSRRAVTPGNIV